MSKIYADDNIYEAMEKVARLPKGLHRAAKGTRMYLDKPLGRKRTSLWGHRDPWQARYDFRKTKVPPSQETRVMDHLEGRARARSIAKERKVKVASDDNIHDALEKVAMNKNLLGAAAGGALTGAALYGAYKAIKGGPLRGSHTNPDASRARAVKLQDKYRKAGKSRAVKELQRDLDRHDRQFSKKASVYLDDDIHDAMQKIAKVPKRLATLDKLPFAERIKRRVFTYGSERMGAHNVGRHNYRKAVQYAKDPTMRKYMKDPIEKRTKDLIELGRRHKASANRAAELRQSTATAYKSGTPMSQTGRRSEVFNIEVAPKGLKRRILDGGKTRSPKFGDFVKSTKHIGG